MEVEAEGGKVGAEIPAPAILVVEDGLGARREQGEWTRGGAQAAGLKGVGELLGEAVSVVEVFGYKDLAQRSRIVAGGDGAPEAGAASEDQQRRGKDEGCEAAQEGRTEREQGCGRVEKVWKGRPCGNC